MKYIQPFILTLIISVATINTHAQVNTDTSKESLAHFSPTISSEFMKLIATANLAEGKEYFMRKCSSCHDEYKSKTHGKGPNLWNILDRKAGSAIGFSYSTAMRESGHTWNLATLNYYLTKTKRAVPGRSMNFRGIKKEQDRAKLLLFLSSMNDGKHPN